MTTDRVLDKLSKLKAAADGEAKLGNSAAAEAFAEAINRLLLQHELSEADIPLKAENDPIVELRVDPEQHGVKLSRSRVGWQETLASVVARAHLCRILVHTGTNYVTFVGTRSHTAFAEQAFATLMGAADRMSVEARDAYWREHRDDEDFEAGNYRAAWLAGFIQRVSQRFDEARRKEVMATVSSSTALIRLDQALVRASSYIDDKYKRKASAVSMGSGISRGVQDGRRAADQVGINQRGVSGSQQRRLK